MISHRRLAIIAGALYLVTFATSIPALAIKTPFLEGAAGGASAQWAAVLEIALALSCIGTAVAFYPIGRAYNPALSLGFVTSRLLEASLVATGVIALLSLMTLRAGDSGAGDGVDAALVAVHDWAFLVGPGFMPAVNAALFGAVLFRARLVPRIIPIVGFIGAPLLATSATLTLFGVVDQVSAIAAATAFPIALWELSIGVWLIVKGVKEPVHAPSAAGGAPSPA